MKIPFFDLKRSIQAESEELHQCLDEVINSGFYIGGPFLQQFENNFADFLGISYSAGVANGLDAIRLMLEAAGIGADDEVIVPAFTYYASWLGVIQTGAKLIPVDVELNTGNIDASKVEVAISPKTKAILAVHLYGQGADTKTLLDIAQKHNLLLFEDVAQSHGAMSSGGLTGTVGTAAAFSFYPTKNLGALGDAGAISTSTKELLNRIISRRSYGQGGSKYEHIDTGWNSRLDPLQASFLSLHLTKLEDWTTKRRNIAKSYLSALSPEIHKSVIGIHSGYESVWHHFILRSENRDELRKFLTSNGVDSDIHYPYSITDIHPLAGSIINPQNLQFPNSELLSQQVLSLPMGPWMSSEEVSYVCGVINKIPRDLFAA